MKIEIDENASSAIANVSVCLAIIVIAVAAVMITTSAEKRPAPVELSEPELFPKNATVAGG